MTTAVTQHDIHCVICGGERDSARLPRVSIGRYWNVDAAIDVVVPGYMYLSSREHHTSLASLSVAESTELGSALRTIQDAVSRTIGGIRVYVCLFGESAQHVHFHIVPRLPALVDAFVQTRQDPMVDAAAFVSFVRRVYAREGPDAMRFVEDHRERAAQILGLLTRGDAESALGLG